MGRKIVAALCRKEKPVSENALKVGTGNLTMHVPAGMEARWTPGADTSNKFEAVPLIPMDPNKKIGPSLTGKEAEAPAAEAPAVEGPATEPATTSDVPQEAPAGLKFVLGEDSKVVLRDLKSKPEYNGTEATVVEFLPDVQKYQVRFADGRLVKVKPENLLLIPAPPAPEDAAFADVEMKVVEED